MDRSDQSATPSNAVQLSNEAQGEAVSQAKFLLPRRGALDDSALPALRAAATAAAATAAAATATTSEAQTRRSLDLNIEITSDSRRQRFKAMMARAVQKHKFSRSSPVSELTPTTVTSPRENTVRNVQNDRIEPQSGVESRLASLYQRPTIFGAMRSSLDAPRAGVTPRQSFEITVSKQPIVQSALSVAAAASAEVTMASTGQLQSQQLQQNRAENMPRSSLELYHRKVLESTLSHGTALSDVAQDKQRADVLARIKAEQKQHLLGTFEGVFVPCLASSLGTILFLRVPWILAESGLLLSFALLAITLICSLLTWLSMSAIVTNGFLPGGGAYYVLSRALGSPLGGSIGAIYFLGFVCLLSMHSFGAADVVIESVHSIWYDFGIIDGGHYWDLILIAAVLFVLPSLVFNLLGLRVVAKLELFFTFILFLCITSLCLGEVFERDPATSPFGFGLKTLHANWAPQFSPAGGAFSACLALLFPIVIGFLAGLNRSGDLKNPSFSIPLGTLASIAVTHAVYALVILLFALNGDRTRMREHFFFHYMAFPRAGNVGNILFTIGVIVALFGEAIQALLVAPRVLQQMSKDLLPSRLNRFVSRGHEPRIAMLLCALLSLVPLFLGDLDRLFTVISMMTLLCFSCLNLACLVNSLVRAPNWRPRWRYFHWTTALIGTCICSFVLFVISWYYALLCFAVAGMLYLLLDRLVSSSHQAFVDDSLSSLRMQTALNSLYSLGNLHLRHTKNWRPQLLVIVQLLHNGEPTHPELLSLAQQMKKGRGLTIVAAVMVGNYKELSEEVRLEKIALERKMQEKKLKGFAQVICAASYNTGIDSLIQCAGLGGLTPNTVVYGFPDPTLWKRDAFWAEQFLETMRLCAAAEKSFIACKGLSQFPGSEQDLQQGNVDLWWISYDGGFELITAFLMMQHRCWRNCKLRVLAVASKEEDDIVFLCEQLENFLFQLRISAECDVIPVSEDDLKPYTSNREKQEEQRALLAEELHLTRRESCANLDLLHDLCHQARSDHQGDANSSWRRRPSLMNVLAGDEAESPSASHVIDIDQGAEEQLQQRPAVLRGAAAACETPMGIHNSHHVHFSFPEVQSRDVDSDGDSGSSADRDAAGGELVRMALKLNELIRSKSSDSSLVLVNMPALPDQEGSGSHQAQEYMRSLEMLTQGIERVLYLRGSGREVISYYI